MASMVVVLADSDYQVAHRPHPFTRDADGTPVAGALPAVGPARPGASTRQPDGTWTLRLDPAEWPVRTGDVVTTTVDGAPRVWVVTGVPRLASNPASGDVDYIAATAADRTPEVP